MYGPLKSNDNSSVDDNQKTFILDDEGFLEHFRALANQISLKNTLIFKSVLAD